MTNDQIKEALTGDWLQELALSNDCMLASELEDKFKITLMLAMVVNDPIHYAVHLMIACCKFGYAFRIREEGIQELENIYKL